jgi:Hydrazine synthase alpha subunit middle domain
MNPGSERHSDRLEANMMAPAGMSSRGIGARSRAFTWGSIARKTARPAFLGGLALLAACSGGDNTAVTVNGDVAIAYAKRNVAVTLNPLNGAPSAPGGDLMVREKSSPSASEHNLTAQFTQGKGDVTDPEVSYDGTKIVFAMNCPASNTSTINGTPACTGHWNIWEYDMTTGGLVGGTFQRITNSTTADDVAPNYLPAGSGFVFSSNRQTKSFASQALGQSYFALDEYERERVFNLHTMDLKGGNIQQISFNQSHDRNPVVRPNGDIMYSRWEHVGGRNRFSVFRAKPDGSDLFVLYGAHSSGNSFLHPRDMDPNGPYKGFLSTDLMPLDRTHEGGALMFIDAANYSEENTPVSSSVPAQGGQKQATAQALNFDTGLSLYGRVTTPYPIWDGTNRVLLAYAPCQVTRSGVVVPCSTLSAAEITRLSNTNRLATDAVADALQDNVPPAYSIYMFDPSKQTFLIVASPPSGFLYKNPVSIVARTEPSAAQPTPVDPTLAGAGIAQIEVRSVYDTDGLGRMGDPVLAAADLPSGCTVSIAKTTPTDPLDARPLVADLVKIKDPANAAYGCAPARFVRVIRAVAPPSSSMGLRQAIGNTDFEPQQILGYAPVEADGSIKLNIPADTPIALQVLDSKGRAFQVHTNWIQARPGERRTCDGCHGPRRGGALNSGAIVNSVPTSWLPAMASAHQPGETMSSTLFRLNAVGAVTNYAADPVYNDVWADTSKAGVTARLSIAIRYTGNTLAADDLTTTVPVNGIINYPDHIQPLWTANRGASTCVTCHADPTKLDLGATIAGTGRMASYEALTVGAPVVDPVTGLPVTEIQDGVLVIKRGPALVTPTGSESDAVGMARKSRLIEIMFGETLMSDANSQTAHPNPPGTAPNHATMLSAAEKRLITEWIDLGAKYYNDPFNGASGVRSISTLSQATFTAQVLPILTKTCAANCHQGIGSNQLPPPGTSFVDNKFVLTGDPAGDFNVTLTMITDTCHPDANLLLSMPSTIPHPPTATGQTTAVLPLGSADYNTISSWILSGC